MQRALHKRSENVKTRFFVYETVCPQQMLVHKGGQIINVQVITGERADVKQKLKALNNLKKLGVWGLDGYEQKLKVLYNLFISKIAHLRASK